MNLGSRHRFTLVEYGKPKDVAGELASQIGRDRGEARKMLIKGGARAAKALGFNENPIIVDEAATRARDIAGLMRLGPSIELEIAPKFLGFDEVDGGWREDFFFLATLSRHGRLLAADRLGASRGAPRDLSALVAKAMSSMYWDNHRRPLRSYRFRAETDFFLEGEVDPVDLCLPQPDGFAQEVLRFDRRNQHNALITAAAKELLPEVGDPAAVSGLLRMISHLGEQQPIRGTPLVKRLPGRNSKWQPLTDLSTDVLNGLGISFGHGAASVPGYVVSTWQIWQDLVEIACRLAFGASAIHAQKDYLLGHRLKPPFTNKTMLNVFPDIVIESGGEGLIVDAKYKGRGDKASISISESDIYESLAFANAVGKSKVALVYPALPCQISRGLGNCQVFETVQIQGVEIIGLHVEVRGISARGGLTQFASELSKKLRDCFTL